VRFAHPYKARGRVSSTRAAVHQARLAYEIGDLDSDPASPGNRGKGLTKDGNTRLLKDYAAALQALLRDAEKQADDEKHLEDNRRDAVAHRPGGMFFARPGVASGPKGYVQSFVWFHEQSNSLVVRVTFATGLRFVSKNKEEEKKKRKRQTP